jgi:hypothetical protein
MTTMKKIIIAATMSVCAFTAHGQWEVCTTIAGCHTVTENPTPNVTVTTTSSESPIMPTPGSPGSVYARERGPVIPEGWRLVAVIPIMENGSSTSFVQYFLLNEKNQRTQIWIVQL